MQKTIVCVCPYCQRREEVTEADDEKWIQIRSRVLSVTANFKSRLVLAVYLYEYAHWWKHCPVTGNPEAGLDFLDEARNLYLPSISRRT